MACIVSSIRGSSLSGSAATHLHSSERIYFLTGFRDGPVIPGQGLPANAFPAYICRHREDWILYAGSNASLALNGRAVLLERRVLKEGDVLDVGESGSLRFLLNADM